MPHPKKGTGQLIEAPERYKNDINDIKFALNLMTQGMTPQEITRDHEVGMSTRQLKMLRYIKEKGDEDDMQLVLDDIYFLSRIKMGIQRRKKVDKWLNKNSTPLKKGK
jgi:hypothetical protein